MAAKASRAECVERRSSQQSMPSAPHSIAVSARNSATLACPSTPVDVNRQEMGNVP